MTDRVTQTMTSATMLNNIDSALETMQRTSDELSSGKTILEPSDNPYGASRVIDLQSQLDGLSSYIENADDGVAWENTASGAMANIEQITQRVRELLVQAGNGTNSQDALEAMAVEVEQLTEGVKQDANVQYAGQNVFSGTLTTTAPYESGPSDEYHGNAESISRSVGPNSSVTISTNLSTLLGSGEDGKLLGTLRTIAEHLRGASSEDRAALGTSDLVALDGNMQVLSQLQATAGSATDQLRTAIARNEDLQGSITESLSSTDDANIAATTIAFSSEQAAYEAALRSGATIVQESLLNFLQ